ncbi:hypothetical protein C4J81_15325 [Deltaproteobacteria bacterium Smac51]|nr:hypothetical protein C4J81_10060 [Deltaproteobacteria bacterium Smac51]UQZ90502.1 hypothetical protein C4J81_15325 [Deltaproteobacteria bacterium Smac51]
MKTRLVKYFWNVLIGLDQFINTMLAGHPDETFSARTYRKAIAGQWFWRAMCAFIDSLFFWQDDHCRKSHENELRRGHSPRESAG